MDNDSPPELESDMMHAEDSSDDESMEQESGQESKCTCLFCPHEVEGVDQIMAHMKEVHDFDLMSVRFQLNDYSWIQLVNYIRKLHVAADAVLHALKSRESPWSREEFYRPVLDNDPLLLWEPDEEAVEAMHAATEKSTSASPLEQLQARLRATEERAKMAEEALQRAVTDLNSIREQSATLLLGDEAAASSVSLKRSGSEESLDGDESDPYFMSYANVSIHREMLQDTVRTSSYRDFILGNEAVFKDKVVLDVGCGTGILSMFAARAGAAKVYAVDRSSIVYQAMAIIRENNLEDKITVIRGEVEKVKLPCKVDIIISEWMGYFLLYEAMFDSVLNARDKFLAPGGNVFPAVFTMHMVGLDDDSFQSKLDYWKDVYGFSMSTMRSSDLLEAEVAQVTADGVATTSTVFKTLDAHVVNVKDLEFESSFRLECTRDTTLTALCSYFDTHFASSPEQKEVMFSCSPATPTTHWKQTVFVLNETLPVKKGYIIEGDISVKKQKQHQRALHVELKIRVQSSENTEVCRRVQEYVVQ
ncbi:uncharacterized protein LOC135817361 [Sycon ciliatum]|uniref:uncharacterized protein LOC135817361 n=1 Tax=Sycon ciliatum TaxID=27933 RepID=UPI0020AC709E|eukprot:scpid60268/ scgid21343/ Protein arginine N-methyltransferase 3; Heterogeneous nuclear ribonucleoprotein methyltransferase-like protein 3